MISAEWSSRISPSCFQELAVFRCAVLKRVSKVRGMERCAPRGPLHPSLSTIALAGVRPDAGGIRFALEVSEGATNGPEFVEKEESAALPWARLAIERQSRQLTQDFEQDPLLSLGNERAQDGRIRMEKALVDLRRIWPEAGSWVDRTISRFVWCSAPSLWSSTDPGAFGAIFINPRPEWGAAHFVETLVHESGHLSLMIKETFDPLLLNREHRSVSPLRPDPRPLRGILHAVFVLSRMAEAHRRLEAARLPGYDPAEVARLRQKALDGWGKGLATLEREARFTPAGAALFGSLREGHQEEQVRERRRPRGYSESGV